ncbi:non-ribosomal peptide synthetase [Brevibacillus choshinensis]|uniref:Amino acid adenylation domain-containing protein n=1 Tax=Brevibacillus choshinensis TaxID=54911 RepID=A0ABX7FWA5_BRECH|nr:non-ribosomal peptide synthetase [Brevibacillus choshinensis]QRG69741.1 amino acid adenylation domain-containing protein [Brevibacillus choshinensis]
MKHVLLEQEDVGLSTDHGIAERAFDHERRAKFYTYVWKLAGQLDSDALQEAMDEIVRRHEVLRMSVSMQNGIPANIVQPFLPLKWTIIDLRPMPKAESDVYIQMCLQGRNFSPLETARESDPPLRTVLLKVSDTEHLFLLQVYASAADDWSIHILQEELFAAYQAFQLKESPQWREQPVSFESYRQWREKWCTGQTAVAELAFWKKKMGYEPPEQYLPVDSSGAPAAVLTTHTYQLSIPPHLKQQLYAFSNQQQLSPFHLLLTVLKMLLRRYGNEDEIRVATLVSRRDDPAIERGIGSFANLLLLQTFWKQDLTFREALFVVQQTLTEAYQRQRIPFDYVVKELGLSRTAQPLYRVMFHMPPALPKIVLPGLQITKLDTGNRCEEAELVIKATESEEGMKFLFTYATNKFSEDSIIRMGGHFTTLLSEALAHPDVRVTELPMLTSAESQQLLVEWNLERATYPRDLSIPEVFEQQVKEQPDEVALLFEDSVLSYRQLNDRANEIASRLRALQITPDQLVAVCLDRSFDMIASYLGVLKAGGAYVPIDLTYPKERIAYMLEDAAVPFVITTERIAKDLPAITANWLYLDKDAQEPSSEGHEPCRVSTADSLAYVMYTSGSTGKPKGVMVDHRGIVRLVKDIDYASVGPDEVYMNLGAVAFDVSAFEIYGALLNGGKLVILPTNKPSFEEIARTIERYKVTSLNITPDRLNVLLEDHSEALRGLRQVMPGGEALPVWLARKCMTKLPNSRLINLYGPTENAVNTTSYHVKELPENATMVPIGRPIANDRLYILDDHLQPVPIGVIGDLYIAGDGVAKGYLNRPELTEERFPKDPFGNVPGRRMYKSGDLARYRADGNVEFIGRADDQVKIRGCRIELGEIETVVGTFSGVRQAVAGVTKSKDGSANLIAYVVMNAGVSFDQGKLREFVRDRLPEYMIPTFFLELQEVPVTPVGKIDRRRLPEPTVASNEELVVQPRNQVEEKLVQIWEKLLEVKPIGVTDNFFLLGGNSLLAMTMFSYIEKTFQKRLSVSSVFQEDTIEKLARLLSSGEEHAELSKSLVPIQPLGQQAPMFCIHGGGGEVLIYGDLARRLGKNQPLYGLRYSGGGDRQVSVEEMAAKYIQEIREVQTKGPYHLIGFCLGGAIAYEMAQQLRRDGQEIGLLTILNYANPALPPLKTETKIINSFKLLFQLPPDLRTPFVMQKLRFVGNVLKKTMDSTPGDDDSLQVLIQAMRAYRPEPYSGRLLLIRAMTNLNQAEKLGWKVTDEGQIEEHCMTADHGTLLKEPNLITLIEHVRNHLNVRKGERNLSSF